MSENSGKYTIATYYRFVPIDDPLIMKKKLLQICNNHSIKGTILLAPEGINATIAGEKNNIKNSLYYLKLIDEFRDIECKLSAAEFIPFKKMKIRLKQEIVRMRCENIIDMQKDGAGTYLDANEWDNLIQNDDVILIDTRNYYEIAFGSFKGAINPSTQNFSDFPEWFEKNIDLQNKDQKIAMFCTGGIRCEKSTAYAKKLGFKNVYHLKGGVLKYLEDKVGKPTMWEGNLFLFDDRIAVDKNLEPLNEEKQIIPI